VQFLVKGDELNSIMNESVLKSQDVVRFADVKRRPAGAEVRQMF